MSQYIVVLGDEETFTTIEGSKVVEVPDDFIGEKDELQELLNDDSVSWSIETLFNNRRFQM